MAQKRRLGMWGAVAAAAMLTPLVPSAIGSADSPSLSAAPSAVLPAGYQVLTDDTRTITVAVPVAWSDIDTAPANVGGVNVPYIAASTSLAQYAATYDVPGVVVAAMPFAADPSAYFTAEAVGSACQSVATAPYDDGVFVGQQQTFTGCGTTGQSELHSIAASPPDQLHTLIVQVQLTGQQDQEAFGIIQQTFGLVGSTLTAPATPTAPAVPAVPTVPTAPSPPIPSTPLVDDTGIITVSVPTDWIDVDSTPDEHDDGSDRPTIEASPDIATADAGWTVPYTRFAAFPSTTEPAALLALGLIDCVEGAPAPFDNGRFVGLTRTLTGCAGTAARVVEVAARPPDGSFTAYIEIIVIDSSNSAVDLIISSFGLVPGAVIPASEVREPPVPVGAVPPTLLQLAAPPDAIPVSDDVGRVSVSVPAGWVDTNTLPGTNDDGSPRSQIIASPSIDGLLSTWQTPGVVITVYGPTDEALLLDNKGWASTCTDGGFLTFDNGTFAGWMRIWSNCAGTNARMVTLAMAPADQSVTVYVEMTLPDADDTPLQIVLASLRLT